MSKPKYDTVQNVIHLVATGPDCTCPRLAGCGGIDDPDRSCPEHGGVVVHGAIHSHRRPGAIEVSDWTDSELPDDDELDSSA